MIAQRLQRVLMGWCLVCLSFGLLPKVAFATAPQQEATPDGQRAQLLAKKSEEWQILRELGELTVAPVDSFTPVYTDTPFTQLADGTIQFGEQRYRRYVPVASAAELTAALATANAGDFIHLRDGLYAGNFVIDRSGQADQPIALYGSRQAILQGQSIKSGVGLHLQADHWRLLGFTIRNSATGLLFAAANHNLVSALQLHQIGNAAIHLQRASRDNRLEKSWIYDVGLATPALGNGIIIGSAATEWATVSGGNPDRSDRN